MIVFSIQMFCLTEKGEEGSEFDKTVIVQPRSQI